MIIGVDNFNWGNIQPILNNHRLVKRANQTELLDGWDTVNISLRGIQAQCPNVGGADEEPCTSGPFTEFTIRGTQGTAKNDGRWWWVTDNKLGLNDYTGGKNSGGCSIVIRDGYQVKLKFSFETNTAAKKFKTAWKDAPFDSSWDGVIDKTDTSTTVVMKAGDKLSVDIDSEWKGIAKFYLSVQGAKAFHESTHSLSDECFIELLGVYTDGSGSNGGSNGGGEEDFMFGMSKLTVGLIGAGAIVGIYLLIS